MPGLAPGGERERHLCSLRVERRDGRVYRCCPDRNRSGENLNKVEAELLIRALMNGFECQGVFVGDSAGCSWLDEPQRPYEEHVWLVDPIRDETLDLANEIRRDRMTEVARKGQRADR